MKTRNIFLLAGAAVLVLVGIFFAVIYYFLELNPPEDPEMVEQEVQDYLEDRYGESFIVEYDDYTFFDRNLHFLEASPVNHENIVFDIEKGIESNTIRDFYPGYQWDELGMDELLSNEVDAIFSDADQTDISVPAPSVDINTEIFLSLEEDDLEWNTEEERIYELIEFYDDQNIYGTIRVFYENIGVMYDIRDYNYFHQEVNDFEDIEDSEDVSDYQQTIEEFEDSIY